MAKISDLKENDRRVDVTGVVVKMETPREIITRFGRTKVANAILEDDSDRIALTLWGDNCDKINEGDKVKISNGYVRLWNGVKQLSVGRFGKIEKVDE